MEDIRMIDEFEQKRKRDPKIKEFTWWFIHLQDNYFRAVNIENKGQLLIEVGEGNSIEECLKETSDDLKGVVLSDWERFKYRPEFYVYDFGRTKAEDKSMTKLQQFNELLCGCAYIEGLKKLGVEWACPDDEYIEKEKERVVKCIKWLESSGFYHGPASTKYHDCEPGGLLNHTLRVVECMKDLMRSRTFCTVNIASAILCALVHDWCKIDMYETYFKNVKDPDGSWRQEIAYTYKENRRLALGHGVSSMYAASKFFHLSYEQSLAIRWHMGEYNVADNEMNELHQANCQYPIVQLLQFADRLSITDYCG